MQSEGDTVEGENFSRLHNVGGKLSMLKQVDQPDAKSKREQDELNGELGCKAYALHPLPTARRLEGEALGVSLFSARRPEESVSAVGGGVVFILRGAREELQSRGAHCPKLEVHNYIVKFRRNFMATNDAKVADELRDGDCDSMIAKWGLHITSCGGRC